MQEMQENSLECVFLCILPFLNRQRYFLLKCPRQFIDYRSDGLDTPTEQPKTSERRMMSQYIHHENHSRHHLQGSKTNLETVTEPNSKSRLRFDKTPEILHLEPLLFVKVYPSSSALRSTNRSRRERRQVWFSQVVRGVKARSRN